MPNDSTSWKLVPVEPTIDMHNAAAWAGLCGSPPSISADGRIEWRPANASTIYRAMLSASPPAPSDWQTIGPELVEALKALTTARALAGVRDQVAGWNGEGRPDGPYERHPALLGATLPKSNCGAVYELDDALQSARAALAKASAIREG